MRGLIPTGCPSCTKRFRILPLSAQAGTWCRNGRIRLRQLPEELLWIVGSTYRGHRTDAGPISRPIGANMAARREALLELGGFPSAFGPRAGTKVSSNEELATYTAITNHFGDQSVRYVPTAVVHHFAPAARCTPRYVICRSLVEGTSKADVRRMFGSDVMGADRAYVRDVIASGILAYLIEGVRKRDPARFVSPGSWRVPSSSRLAHTWRDSPDRQPPRWSPRP